MTDNNSEIPPNATIRQEYVKCGNPDCQNQHGPYLYAYWKEDKKLNKRYVGKNFDAFRLRKIAKEIKLKPSLLIKFKFIEQQANKGNVLAKQYLEKLRKEEVSIDWAHRVLIKIYNKYKDFEGRKYTGTTVGRSHKWYYDKGEWKEKKITPDKWELSYAVTKRRAGHAPEGSGVPVGTEYNWYILAHQNVRKLDANNYSTSMTGLKYKLAHKRAEKEKWDISDNTQRKRLIQVLQELIDQLKNEITVGSN